MSENKEVELILGRLCPSIGLLGFVLNLFILLVFSTRQFRTASILYDYLRMEAMFICVNMLLTTLKPIYYCHLCLTSHTLLAEVYFVYFNIYAAGCLEMSAIICRNLAALICLLLISNWAQSVLNFFKNQLIIMSLVVSFSCAIYSYTLFEYRIVKSGRNETNNNSEFWLAERTDFGQSKAKGYWEISATIVRDCVNLFVLVSVNILILVQLKINLSKKRKMLSSSGGRSVITEAIAVVVVSTSTTTTTLRNIQRKENLQTVMLLLTCFNYLIGRLPLLYLFVKRNLFVDTSLFGIYAILVAYVSYSLNFWLYYFSNQKFKSRIKFFAEKFLGFLFLKKSIKTQ